jgi:signal transduction histidine kinase
MFTRPFGVDHSCTTKNVSVFINANLLNVKISVQDSGIGISKQDLPHIFSKFYRGKNARVTDTEGFGVGLYLASSIVKKLGGKITVDSQGQDSGSVFTITLPRAR